MNNINYVHRARMVKNLAFPLATIAIALVLGYLISAGGYDLRVYVVIVLSAAIGAFVVLRRVAV